MNTLTACLTYQVRGENRHILITNYLQQQGRTVIYNLHFGSYRPDPAPRQQGQTVTFS